MAFHQEPGKPSSTRRTHQPRALRPSAVTSSRLTVSSPRKQTEIVCELSAPVAVDLRLQPRPTNTNPCLQTKL